LKSEVTHDLSNWRIPVTPKDILVNNDFDSITDNQIEIDEEADGSSLTYGGPPYRLSQPRYETNCKKYKILREHMKKRLKEEGVTQEKFLAELGSSASG
jgi:hypothetical protein